MTSKDFCNWLKGYLEALDEKSLNKKDIKKIKDKLENICDIEAQIGLQINPDVAPEPMKPYEPYKSPYETPGTGDPFPELPTIICCSN